MSGRPVDAPQHPPHGAALLSVGVESLLKKRVYSQVLGRKSEMGAHRDATDHINTPSHLLE